MGLLQPVELGGGRRPQEMEDQMGFAFHNIGELCPTLLGDSDLLLHSYETGSGQQENDFTFQPLWEIQFSFCILGDWFSSLGQ